jgi:hypothetical protein
MGGGFNRAAKTSGRSGANLSQSTYIPDDQTLKAMNSRISSGKSKPNLLTNFPLGVIGGTSPKVESKLNNLAMLLGSEDDFKDAFATKHASNKIEQKPKAKKVDLIKDLLEMSRKFILKG